MKCRCISGFLFDMNKVYDYIPSEYNNDYKYCIFVEDDDRYSFVLEHRRHIVNLTQAEFDKWFVDISADRDNKLNNILE